MGTMLAIPARLWRKLRIIAYMLVVAGIGFPAVMVPLDALGVEGGYFDRLVGWANILSLSVAAVGMIMLISEKVGNLIAVDYDSEKLAGGIALKLRRQGARTLALLLATAGPEARSAPFQLLLTESARRKSASRTMTREQLDEFFLDETEGRLVIMGDPGSGKSVLALQLAGQLLSRFEKIQQVPLVISLASWDSENVDLEDWLVAEISIQCGLTRLAATKLVHENRVLPILDGLDELVLGGETTRLSAAVEKINNYVAQTPACRIVVTSRGGQYFERSAKRLRDLRIVWIEPLSRQKVIEHIDHLCFSSERYSEWKPLLTALQARKSRYLTDVLCTPWRLNAAIVYFLSGGNPTVLLASAGEVAKDGAQTTEKYQRRIRDLLVGEFVFNRLYAHSPDSDPELIMLYLQIVADRIRKYSALYRDASEFVFLHRWWEMVGGRGPRLVQLIATFILLHLPSVALGFGEIEPARDVRSGLLIFAGSLSLYITIFWFSFRYVIVDRAPSVINLKQLRRTRTIFLVLIFSAPFVGAGMYFSVVNGVLYGSIFGTIGVLTVLLAAGTSRPQDEQLLAPVQAIRNDRSVALVSGLLIGAYAILYCSELYPGQWAFWFGGMCAVGRFCGSAYMRYLAAVLYAAMKFILPFRFGRFLERNRKSGLLRVSGAGYQFRHREVLEFFQDRATDYPTPHGDGWLVRLAERTREPKTGHPSS